MEEKLGALMADLFDLRREDIGDGLAMRDTDGWDSLRHMEFVMSIERAFDVELSFDEIIAMQTVSDVKRVLKEKGVNGDHGSAG